MAKITAEITGHVLLRFAAPCLALRALYSQHYFQSPFLAVREILDNMLAPSRSRNIALFNGGQSFLVMPANSDKVTKTSADTKCCGVAGRPLTITVDVTVLGSVVDPQTGHEKLKKKLCITCESCKVDCCSADAS
jgi:hypothetical protein